MWLGLRIFFSLRVPFVGNFLPTKFSAYNFAIMNKIDKYSENLSWVTQYWLNSTDSKETAIKIESILNKFITLQQIR